MMGDVRRLIIVTGLVMAIAIAVAITWAAILPVVDERVTFKSDPVWIVKLWAVE